MKRFFKKMPAGRVIALAFLSVIILGAVLLSLPVSHKPGVSVGPLDALFTATSAVCVTGLAVFDTADTFSSFGRVVILLLIQTGGLGVSTLGVTLVLFTGGHISLRQRMLLKESWNVASYGGLVRLLRRVLAITFSCEAAGAFLAFFVFRQSYPFWKAVGISIFHAVSSFNNAGFDIFGGGVSMLGYADNVFLNLLTAALIIVSGIGFSVLIDAAQKKRFRTLKLQSKIALTTSAVLIIAGALLLKLLQSDLTWLGAFFQSVSTRTAGFATVGIGELRPAALFVMCLLMFVGASPGGTGGGVKTTTLFAMLLALRSAATNSRQEAFRRKIPGETIRKAFVVTLLAVLIVIAATLLLSAFEPELDFISVLFECVSAFGTVGLTTGVTGGLGAPGRVLLIIVMFIGRIGPLTVATLWLFKPTSAASYSEEGFTIG